MNRKHNSNKLKGGIIMAGTIIVKDAVKRREGYIYYIDGSGNLCEAKRALGRKKGVKKVKVSKPKKAKTTKKKVSK